METILKNLIKEAIAEALAVFINQGQLPLNINVAPENEVTTGISHKTRKPRATKAEMAAVVEENQVAADSTPVPVIPAKVEVPEVTEPVIEGEVVKVDYEYVMRRLEALQAKLTKEQGDEKGGEQFKVFVGSNVRKILKLAPTDKVKVSLLKDDIKALNDFDLLIEKELNTEEDSY